VFFDTQIKIGHRTWYECGTNACYEHQLNQTQLKSKMEVFMEFQNVFWLLSQPEDCYLQGHSVQYL